MQSGKILGSFRTFLSTPVAPKGPQKDPQSKKDQDQQQSQKEPNEEEILEAVKVLNALDSFKLNELSAEASKVGEKTIILVKDKKGHILRTISGMEIFRIFTHPNLVHQGPQLGSILDRRV